MLRRALSPLGWDIPWDGAWYLSGAGSRPDDGAVMADPFGLNARRDTADQAPGSYGPSADDRLESPIEDVYVLYVSVFRLQKVLNCIFV